MNDDAQKRRGRPPKAPDERKGGNLTIRLRGGAREKLEKAADEARRSLSEEIEHRIGLSFEWERAFGELEAWRAKQKAAQESIARGNLKAVLDDHDWQKVADVDLPGMKGVTVYVDPESMGRLEPRPRDGIERNGFVDMSDPRNERWREAEMQPAPAAPADLEQVIYSAIVRALRDVREEEQ